ncbi:MAG: AMP-binding protein, partial [Candidatus Margulisiibacteriota bacterium]|nr:AMP-binding protein [Candidatus Margulisiibacteriota bacterium]
MTNQKLTIDLKRVKQPEDFINKQHTITQQLYDSANTNRLKFWDDQAAKLHWQKKWNETLIWEKPYAKWFVNGSLNAAENCLDIHLETHKNKTAIIWEGESGNIQTYTYLELSNKVNQLANAFENKLSITKGDRVTIYMPLVPEAVIAMLACSRIGAIHSVVFGGFSAPSLAERLNDSKSKCIITANDANRRGKKVPLRSIVEDAINKSDVDQLHVITLNKSNPSNNDYDFN